MEAPGSGKNGQIGERSGFVALSRFLLGSNLIVERVTYFLLHRFARAKTGGAATDVGVFEDGNEVMHGLPLGHCSGERVASPEMKKGMILTCRASMR
jgi:hypothetical protein